MNSFIINFILLMNKGKRPLQLMNGEEYLNLAPMWRIIELLDMIMIPWMILMVITMVILKIIWWSHERELDFWREKEVMMINNWFGYYELYGFLIIQFSCDCISFFFFLEIFSFLFSYLFRLRLTPSINWTKHLKTTFYLLKHWL